MQERKDRAKKGENKRVRGKASKKGGQTLKESIGRMEGYRPVQDGGMQTCTGWRDAGLYRMEGYRPADLYRMEGCRPVQDGGLQTCTGWRDAEWELRMSEMVRGGAQMEDRMEG